MTRIPFIPESAPFTAEQRQWLNGFLAGMFSDANAAAAAMAGLPFGAGAQAEVKKEPLLLLYGSQTGTAEGIAKKTAKEAEKRGFAPKVLSLEKYAEANLAAESNLLVITSTYGDGEPPDNAQAFWTWLASDAAPQLPQLRYSVLALGDTNYPAFCAFGKACDERLEKLGARRVAERRDCDVDYETPTAEWRETALAALTGSPAVAAGATIEEAEAPTGYGKANPFPARLLKNIQLSRTGSAKDVRHFEIELTGSDLAYEAGDALGVVPSNCPQLVGEMLAALGCDGEEAVKAGTAEMPLRLALAQHFDISKPSRDFLAAAAARSPGSELAALLAPDRAEDLKRWLYGRDVLDVLHGIASPFAPADFTALLKKIAPRLYSISSSPKAHPGEVHLTVSAVRYESLGRARGGVASTFLADRVGDACRVPVFVQPSHGFKLPADTSTPVIMVGPGTGIAPFRAFLEERQAVGASGPNWLFFGDQKRATDFLYEEQLTAWEKDGFARLDLAFSRDQAEKIYVQTRMLEAAADLWAWLEAGAHFYVCGDASRMAKDVDAALHTIIESAGGKSSEEAAAYVSKLKSDKRYQRDVY